VRVEWGRADRRPGCPSDDSSDVQCAARLIGVVSKGRVLLSPKAPYCTLRELFCFSFASPPLGVTIDPPTFWFMIA
jgi:hypothetical protein